MCKAKYGIDDMRNSSLATGNYYHIYNRGVEKRKIFLHQKDYGRFLETIDFYRISPQPLRLSQYRNSSIKENLNKIGQRPIVEILCFCLMPNHFHLLIRQMEDGGITEFMRKIQDSYSKFFNIKYDRVGGLFQGSFKAKIIDSEEYLLQLSKYIHRNPASLNNCKIADYPYSSLSDYCGKRVFGYCSTDLILSYFSDRIPDLTYSAFIDSLDFTDLEPLIIEGITIDHDD